MLNRITIAGYKNFKKNIIITLYSLALFSTNQWRWGQKKPPLAEAVAVMFSSFFNYIQPAPPLIAGIIMTFTTKIVMSITALYNLLFNIDVCCNANIPP
jgi:hypothetical protein